MRRLTTPLIVRTQQYALMAGDFLIAALVLGAVQYVSRPWPTEGQLPFYLAAVMVIIPMLLVAACAVLDLYNIRQRFGSATVVRLVVAVAVTVVVPGLVLTGYGWNPSPGAIVAAGGVIGLMIGAWRWYRLRYRRPAKRHRIAFLDDCQASREAADFVRALPFLPYEVVQARVSEDAEVAWSRIGGAKLIVLPVWLEWTPRLAERLLDLRASGVRLIDAPTFCGHLTGNIPCDAIDSRWLVSHITRASLDEDGPDEWVRTAFERVVAGLVLLALLPVLLLIAAAIMLDTPGPPLITQERLGLRRRPFRLYKFRTMIHEAESQTGPTWTHGKDPRVTRVGALLRRTGLDEIPQLVNILRGEMQFIGFRPIRAHFADLLTLKIPYYEARFSGRPGITGWAQVKYHYAGSVEGQKRKFGYELYYLRHASLWLDLIIAGKTFQKLLLGRVNDATESEPVQSAGTASTGRLERESPRFESSQSSPVGVE